MHMKNPRSIRIFLLLSLAVVVFLLSRAYGQRIPDLLRVPPAEAESLMSASGDAIRSRLEIWACAWAINTSRINHEVELKKLLDRPVPGEALGVVENAVRQIGNRPVPIKARGEPSDRDTTEIWNKLLDGLAEEDPRLRWFVQKARTDITCQRLLLSSLVAGAWILEKSDPRVKKDTSFLDSIRSIRLPAGAEGPPDSIGDAMLVNKLQAWLTAGSWTCVGATSQSGDGFPGIMKGATFDFRNGQLHVWGQGASATHPYALGRVTRSANGAAELYGVLRIGDGEESVLQLSPNNGLETAGLTWGKGAWTLKLIRSNR